MTRSIVSAQPHCQQGQPKLTQVMFTYFFSCFNKNSGFTLRGQAELVSVVFGLCPISAPYISFWADVGAARPFIVNAIHGIALCNDMPKSILCCCDPMTPLSLKASLVCRHCSDDHFMLNPIDLRHKSLLSEHVSLAYVYVGNICRSVA